VDLLKKSGTRENAVGLSGTGEIPATLRTREICFLQKQTHHDIIILPLLFCRYYFAELNATPRQFFACVGRSTTPRQRPTRKFVGFVTLG
jgi:hypothetical protein